MKITDIKIRRLSCRYTGPSEAYTDTCIVNATDIYPDFRRHSAAARVTITPVKDAGGEMRLTQDFLQIDISRNHLLSAQPCQAHAHRTRSHAD